MSDESRLSPTAQRELVRARRAGARLAGVQALYQMEQTQQSTNSVIADFMEDRLGLGEDGQPVEEADPDLFQEIVHGVVSRQDDVDAAIVRRLAEGWRIDRLDATSRAILRAGVWELIVHRDIPPEILLDEYVDIAHAFFEGAEPKFINGLLDAAAKDIRG